MFDGRTILLLGGTSPEREVSLASGKAVGDSLKRLCAEVVEFDPAISEFIELSRQPVKRVFNILHGGAGENGEIIGALKTMGLAVTGSDVLGSALAMDKHRSKLVWRAQGITTPDWVLANDTDSDALAAEKIGLPLFVKPSRGGSSTAVSVITAVADLPQAVHIAAAEGYPALIEKMITGEEYTASIVDDMVLPLIKIKVAGGFYDYHAKYVAKDTLFECPSGLSDKDEKCLAAMALRCFQSLNCRHWGRVDFIIDANGVAQFLEVNTVPGMTSHSLVPLAAKAAGFDFDELVGRVLRGAR